MQTNITRQKDTQNGNQEDNPNGNTMSNSNSKDEVKDSNSSD